MRYETPGLERWNSRAYDSSFGYVSTQGAPLVDLLDPQPGERVLDLGCGTGVLTAQIAFREIGTTPSSPTPRSTG